MIVKYGTNLGTKVTYDEIKELHLGECVTCMKCKMRTFALPLRVGLHRRFLAIFLKLPFHFVKRQFDFCRFCWLHKPKSVVLFAKLKFRKVKYFFSSHILENLRPNNKG
jgi:hypothetical protein